MFSRARVLAPRNTLRAFVCLMLLSAPGGQAVAQNRFTGQAVAVESGDRFQVRLDGWTMTVRLHGVECPETPPALAEKARAYTARRIENTRVAVEVRGTGAKQTVYGEVTPVTGGSLNEELVRVGLAKWAREYAPTRTELGDLESEAQTAKRGLWGDPNGANVPLPPFAASLAKPTPKPKPVTPKPTPTPTPTPQPATLSPTSDASASPPPSGVTPTPTNAPVSQADPTPVIAPPASLSARAMGAALGAFALGLLLTIGAFVRATGIDRRLLPFQAIVAAFVAMACALLAPFPILLTGATAESAARAEFGPAFLAFAVAACAGTALFWAERTTRQKRLLSATPPVPIADAAPGFTRVKGETSAPNGVVHSAIGGIYGIYIREVVSRYDGTNRNGASGWTVLRDETQTTDFLLTDETGALAVEPARAAFYPLRVARFYNDIPVETFFDKPYGGDTRAEIFFIPKAATLTVWGRLHTTASPDAARSEERMGRDSLHGITIVEGREGRVWGKQTLPTLALVGGTLCAAFALLLGARGTLPFAAVLLVLGGLLLTGLHNLWKASSRAWANVETEWAEVEQTLTRRMERLPELSRLFRACLGETDELRRLEAAPAFLPTEKRAERIEAEQRVSRWMTRLRAHAEAALPALSPAPLAKSTRDDFAAELSEAGERERFLAEARERYNEAADALNTLRHSGLRGLLLRTWQAENAPLFGPVGE